jgi:hypothetical protein
VLVLAALLGPSVASQLGARGGNASAAPPPSAIVDLASAYPVPEAAQDSTAVAMPTQPENALAWPSRGTAVPAQAVDVAKSYLLDHATKPDTSDSSTAATTTATVMTLWAQVDEDTTKAAQKARKTWLYVMQGWTNGSDGAPSQAQLLVGDYTQAGKASSMSVYATPVTFTHAQPGTSDDADDARQIAELSVWLPQSNRLVVLGAPQTATVLYAKTGGDLIPQRTIDGVAVFPRTKQLVRGHYADTIQVRDAKNVALTPPKAWAAGDFALNGAMSLWTSGGSGWVKVPPRTGPQPTKPTTAPSPLTPAPEPSEPKPKPAVVPSETVGAPPARGALSGDQGTLSGSGGSRVFTRSL